MNLVTGGSQDVPQLLKHQIQGPFDPFSICSRTDESELITMTKIRRGYFSAIIYIFQAEPFFHCGVKQ